jgi:hypothetical protein
VCSLVPQVRVRSWDANLGITVRGASLEMQRTYRLLFVFGNLVRRFIDQRFVEEDKKPDWWDGRATAAMKEEGRGSEVRGGEEFMASRPQPPATVLCRLWRSGLLIISHWDVFRDLFPTEVWISSRIQETERSRNVIAPTNRLPEEEGGSARKAPSRLDCPGSMRSRRLSALPIARNSRVHRNREAGRGLPETRLPPLN